MKQITVDRIEDGFAVCEENGKNISLPVSSLPEDVTEGSILIMTENGWILSEKDTAERRKSLFDLQNSLFD